MILMTQDLDDLLIDWEDEFRQGRDLSAEELCRKSPELAAEVAQGIEFMKCTEFLIHPSIGEREANSQSSVEKDQILAERYRLDGLIAESPFAQVWRGFDTILQRAVAVKIPKTMQVDGLLFEACKAARLKHSGIAAVYDVTRHDAIGVVVSELINGKNLSERLQRGRIEVKEAVRIIADAASHLAYVHQQRLVHRNIKPTNILIDDDGRVFITDIGMIRTDGEAQQGANGYKTPAYISPQQAVGIPSEIDYCTDIYSLGLVLYELLTGGLPGQTNDSAGVRGTTHKTKSWQLDLQKRGVPRRVQQICLKCLEEDPRARYPTAKQLAGDLQLWLRTPSLAARLVWIGGIVTLSAAVLTLLVIIVWLAGSALPEREYGGSGRRTGHGNNADLEHFRPFEGTWVVAYSNKVLRNYVVNREGNVLLDPPQERFRLSMRGNDVVMEGDIAMERWRLEGEKLRIDHYNPKDLYPDQPPPVTGLAERKTAAVLGEDAKAFQTLAGKWKISYANQTTHEWQSDANGKLADGRKLFRFKGQVLLDFSAGKLERLTLEGDKLKVEHYDPSTKFLEDPANPQVLGTGVREGQ
jgi:Protein kinase domain